MGDVRIEISDVEIDLYRDGTNGVVNTDYQVAAKSNLAARKASASKAIKVPNTAHNRRVFKFADDALAANGMSQSETVVASIYSGGDIVLHGLVKILSTAQGEGGYFEFQIIGQNSWKDIFGQKTLSQLSAAFLNHYVDADHIIHSHNNIDSLAWMYLIPDALDVDTMYPSECVFLLNIRRLVYEMFNQSGYKIESDFIDSDYFSRLYFAPKIKELDNDKAQSFDFNIGISSDVNHTSPAGSGLQTVNIDIPWNDISTTKLIDGETRNTGYFDNSGQFSTANNLAVLPFDGGAVYGCDLTIGGASINSLSRVAVVYTINGKDVFRDYHGISGNNSEYSIQSKTPPLWFKKGSKISCHVEYEWDISTPLVIDIISGYTTFFANFEVGISNFEFINVQERYLSDSATCLQVIKDLAILFNLMFVTDEQMKVVYVEPEQNAYKKNNPVDISGIIDESTAPVIIDLKADIEKKQTFSYLSGQESASFQTDNIFSTNEKTASTTFFSETEFLAAKTIDTGNLHANINQPSNQILSMTGTGLKTITDYVLYRLNLDEINVVDPPEYTYNLITNFSFNDDTVNLSFKDGEKSGLINIFYSDFKKAVNNIKRIFLTLNLGSLNVAQLEKPYFNKGWDFRALFYSKKHGRLRLERVKNFNPLSTGQTNVEFIQDYVFNEIATTPTSQTALNKDETKPILITKYQVKESVFTGSDWQIGFKIWLSNKSSVDKWVTLFVENYTDNLAAPKLTANITAFTDHIFEKNLTDAPNGSSAINWGNLDVLISGHAYGTALFKADGYVNHWFSEWGYTGTQGLSASIPFQLRHSTGVPVQSLTYKLIVENQEIASLPFNSVPGGATNHTANHTFSNYGLHDYTIEVYISGALFTSINGQIYIE